MNIIYFFIKYFLLFLSIHAAGLAQDTHELGKRARERVVPEPLAKKKPPADYYSNTNIFLANENNPFSEGHLKRCLPENIKKDNDFPQAKKRCTDEDIIDYPGIMPCDQTIEEWFEKTETLRVLGFSLDDIIIKKKCNEDIAYERHPSVLTKRTTGPSFGIPRAKILRVVSDIDDATSLENERYIWQFFNLFEFNASTKDYQLNWDVLQAIEQDFFLRYENANWLIEINNAPALWWLAFIAYGFNRPSLNLLNDALAIKMDNEWLKLAPSIFPCFQIHVLRHFASVGFKPQKTELQNTLKKILKPIQNAQKTPLANQENMLIDAGFNFAKLRLDDI